VANIKLKGNGDERSFPVSGDLTDSSTNREWLRRLSNDRAETEERGGGGYSSFAGRASTISLRREKRVRVASCVVIASGVGGVRRSWHPQWPCQEILANQDFQGGNTLHQLVRAKAVASLDIFNHQILTT
jgi:hypothetical protein